MKTIVFGRLSGLRVSELALGAGLFGGQGLSAEEANKVIDRFADSGGTFIDTSDSYWAGDSERVVGAAIAGRRDDFVLGTKFGRGATGEPLLHRVGNSRRALVRAVEESLVRLRTDHLDVYWAHYEDGVTPMAEIVSALDDLVGAGKILYGGVSNFPAWRVALGHAYAETHGASPLVGVQVEHSLVERGVETEVVPMADALGLGLALYSPLGGGLLSAKHRLGQENRPIVVHTEDTPLKVRALDALVAVADETGRTPAVIALAWQRRLLDGLSTGAVTIVGARSPEQWDAALVGLDISLTDDQFARLSEASEPYRGAPHDGIGGPPDLGDKARVERPRVGIR